MCWSSQSHGSLTCRPPYPEKKKNIELFVNLVSLSAVRLIYGCKTLRTPGTQSVYVGAEHSELLDTTSQSLIEGCLDLVLDWGAVTGFYNLMNICTVRNHCKQPLFQPWLYSAPLQQLKARSLEEPESPSAVSQTVSFFGGGRDAQPCHR